MDRTIVGVLVVYYVAIFAMTVYANKRTHTAEDYYIAGGKLGPILSMGTYFATFISAGALVSWVSLANLWGMFFIWSGVVVAAASLMNWYVFGPKIMAFTKRFGATTLLDILHERFKNNTLRVVTAVMTVIFMVPLIVTQFKAGGMLIQMIAGIPYNTSVIIMGLAVALYVAIGGYLAVVYSDLFQGGLLFLGTVILFGAVLTKVGGITALGQGYAALNPGGAVSWPSLLAGSKIGSHAFFAWLVLPIFGAFGSPYQQVRFMSLRDNTALRRGFWMTAIAVVLVELMVPFLGIGGRVLFPELASNPDITTFTLIKNLMPPLMAGILMAAISAAMMSTIDSILLVASSTVEHDIMRRGLRLEVSQKQRMWIARGVTLVIGVVSMIWGLKPPALIALLFYPAWGVLGLMFAILFTGAFFWKRFNAAGALAATITGPVSFMIWYRLATPRPFGLDPIEVAALIAIPAAIIGTYLAPAPDVPILQKFFPARAGGSPHQPPVTG